MSAVVHLAVLLWRRGGSRQRATLALTGAGVAFAVTLALFALSAGPALTARGERTAWHGAHAVDPAAASARQRTISERFGDHHITRVDLAATGRGRPPVPPGLRAFPRPGEVWVSPALADLSSAEPREALADRWPGRVVGTIGSAGLAHRDELVVVVGRDRRSLPATPNANDIRGGPPYESVEVVPIRAFPEQSTDFSLKSYVLLAQIGAALLVVPALLLLGSAARLTAAQREQRLAVLRLAGATPRAVVGLTALEILAASLVGAMVGVLAYLGLVPHGAHVPLAGGPSTVADLRLGGGPLVLALVIAPLVATASAVIALRKVTIGPLGVRRQLGTGRPRFVRLLAVPLSWLVLVVGAAQLEGGAVAPALLGLGLVIGSLMVVGPLIAWVCGSALTRLSRGPATLIAGRRLTGDTKGAFRTVGGLVLASLVAGFLFGALPTLQAVDVGRRGREVQVEVAGPRGPAMLAAVRAADPGSRFVPGDDSGSYRLDRSSVRGLVTTSTPAMRDRVRTAVLRADPDAVLPLTDDRPSLLQLVADLRRASIVLALSALAMAVVSIAISSSASILDQRVTLARLRLVGTPISVLQRARRWQTLLPLVVASVGAMIGGAGTAQVLMRATGARPDSIEPPAYLELGALGLAAALAGVAVVAATRPLLVAISRSAPGES